MDEELLKEMKALHSKRRLGCPFVFHRNGEPMEDFRWAWNSRCRQAGLKGRLFHDFRTTAIRNMVRAGVSEGVAMKISGHKTWGIFDRYNVINHQGLKEATKKHEIYLKNNSSETSSEQRVILPLKHAQGTSNGRGCGIFKLCVMFQRKPEITVSEFIHWWLEHAKMSRQIPGLKA